MKNIGNLENRIQTRVWAFSVFKDATKTCLNNAETVFIPVEALKW